MTSTNSGLHQATFVMASTDAGLHQVTFMVTGAGLLRFIFIAY